MTAMPVVWCTDPNSVNNKPTAFALHGIQLQGNVTEKQVHALRDLVNAAAEGRLILPSDGTFTLLDSGLSIESSIVQEQDSRRSSPVEAVQTKSAKNTYILMPVSKADGTSGYRQEDGATGGAGTSSIAAAAAQLEFLLESKSEADRDEEVEAGTAGSSGEILYELLCCAKCMNEQRTGHIGAVSCSARRQQRCLKGVAGKSSEYETVNDSAAWQLQLDPVSIASKYARWQQRHKLHGTVSMGIARNRTHRHHKLPMHSVKIFHNRSSYTPATATAPATTLATAACNVGGGREVSTVPMAIPSQIPNPSTSANPHSTRSLATRASRGSEAFSLLLTAARSTSLPATGTGTETASPAVPLYAVVNKARDLTGGAQGEAHPEEVLATAMLAVVPEEQPVPVVEGRDLISFDDDQVQTDGTVTGAASLSVDLCAPNEADALLALLDTPPPTPPKPCPYGSNSSSRKTSFDSTSTHSSMDSGFMEMQNKLDALAAAAAAATAATSAAPGAASAACSQGEEKITQRNYKECLTQSRNRRKSYEEFKAMFAELTAAEATQSECLPPAVAVDDATAAGSSFSAPPAGQPLPLASISEQETKTKDTQAGRGKPDCANEFAASADEMDTGDVDSDGDGTKGDLTAEATATSTEATTESETATKTTVSSVCSTTTEAMRKNSDFLSQILDHQFAAKERVKAHKRRTSYEEFKRLVSEIEPSECQEPLAAPPFHNAQTAAPIALAVAPTTTSTAASPLKRQNSRQRKSFASYFLPRRHSTKEPKTDKENIPLQQPREKELQQLAAYMKLPTHRGSSSSESSQYRRNFKIYDKLVYGTIYDIIQRKNDIYQKYDKYMTYGTIYEILHRKSSACGERWQRKSLSSILEGGRPSGDVIYDIVQKREREKQLQQRAIDFVAQPPTNDPTLSPSHKYGTLYDILQGEKWDAPAGETSTSIPAVKANRFVVSQVAEYPAGTSPAEQSAATATTVVSSKTSKPTKMRRLSHILSYSRPATEVPESQESPGPEGAKQKPKRSQAKRRIGVTNLLLPLDSEELYTRIIAQQKSGYNSEKEGCVDPDAGAELSVAGGSDSEAGPFSRSALTKSSSLDTISLSAATSPAASPSPPRIRRSLKQHRCLHLRQQPPLTKKHSLDNCLQTGVIAARSVQPLRRWSNQAPLKCHCQDSLAKELPVSALIAATPGSTADRLHTNQSTNWSAANSQSPANPKSNGQPAAAIATATKKGKSRRLSEFTRGEFLNEKS